MKVILTPIDSTYFSYTIFNKDSVVEEGIVRVLSDTEPFPSNTESMLLQELQINQFKLIDTFDSTSINS